MTALLFASLRLWALLGRQYPRYPRLILCPAARAGYDAGVMRRRAGR